MRKLTFTATALLLLILGFCQAYGQIELESNPKIFAGIRNAAMPMSIMVGDTCAPCLLIFDIHYRNGIIDSVRAICSCTQPDEVVKKQEHRIREVNWQEIVSDGQKTQFDVLVPIHYAINRPGCVVKYDSLDVSTFLSKSELEFHTTSPVYRMETYTTTIGQRLR